MLLIGIHYPARVGFLHTQSLVGRFRLTKYDIVFRRDMVLDFRSEWQRCLNRYHMLLILWDRANLLPPILWLLSMWSVSQPIAFSFLSWIVLRTRVYASKLTKLSRALRCWYCQINYFYTALEFPCRFYYDLVNRWRWLKQLEYGFPDRFSTLLTWKLNSSLRRLFVRLLE